MSDDNYLGTLTAYFYNLVMTSRGDSARGRSRHALHFLEFAWSNSGMPLSGYRPSRRPAAFLAMVFDLLGDAAKGYTEKLLEGQRDMVRADIVRRLEATWGDFVGALEEAGFPELAKVLDETLQSSLRHHAQSDLPIYLQRLRLYMTPLQLAQIDVRMLVNSLSVTQIFAYLRFEPPTAHAARKEQHPVGGDLRKVIREGFDHSWRRALEEVCEPDFVTLFAVLPVDVSVLMAVPRRGDTFTDFAIFYACITDARAPGRVWQPPVPYVGEDAEAWQHFAFLSARGTRESFSRRAQGLVRLGLSGTFPETIRHIDSWLNRPERFPELHTHHPWQEAVIAQQKAIAQARVRFVSLLAHLLKERT